MVMDKTWGIWLIHGGHYNVIVQRLLFFGGSVVRWFGGSVVGGRRLIGWYEDGRMQKAEGRCKCGCGCGCGIPYSKKIPRVDHATTRVLVQCSAADNTAQHSIILETPCSLAHSLPLSLSLSLSLSRSLCLLHYRPSSFHLISAQQTPH